MARNPATAGDATPTFQQLLKGKAEEAVRPPSLPGGQYLGMIQAVTNGRSRQKKTPYVEFTFALLEPSAEIDAEELEGVDISKKKMRDQFYITPDAMWRLREFFELTMGNVEGRTFEELISDAKGVRVWLDIAKNPTDNGEDFFNEITGYAKAE